MNKSSAAEGLAGWIVSAQRASSIVQAAESRREGLAAAAKELGVGVEMVRKQLDLLGYVAGHAPLHKVKAAQTKLMIFRGIENADPKRADALREKVFADRLTARQIQLELDEAKLRSGLKEPLRTTIDEIYEVCLQSLPVLASLLPPVTRSPGGDALWIGANLDWTLTYPNKDDVPTWCAMISPNFACSRLKKASFLEFSGKVIVAGARYEVVSVILASQPEKQLIAAVLEWALKKINTTIFLHVIGDKQWTRMGRSGDPFTVARKKGGVAIASNSSAGRNKPAE